MHAIPPLMECSNREYTSGCSSVISLFCFCLVCLASPLLPRARGTAPLKSNQIHTQDPPSSDWFLLILSRFELGKSRTKKTPQRWRTSHVYFVLVLPYCRYLTSWCQSVPSNRCYHSMSADELTDGNTDTRKHGNTETRTDWNTGPILLPRPLTREVIKYVYLSHAWMVLDIPLGSTHKYHSSME